LFTIVVLCEIYIVSFRINLLIQLAFLLLLFFTGRDKISKSFLNTVLPVILIFLYGFLGTLLYNYKTVDIIKDVTHLIKPIFVLFIGYLVFKSINNPTKFLKTIINTAAITAIIHLFGVFFLSNFLSSSISDIRDKFGLDNFIEVYSLFMLIVVPKTSIKYIYKNTNYRKILIFIFALSIVMYFSRTMFGMIFLLGLSFYGYTRLTKRSLKIIGVFILGVVLFYTYLGTIKIERNSKGIEALFYKIKMAPGEVFNAKIDIENHKDLWDHWRAYEAKRAITMLNDKPITYLTGSGYGSLVNLKFRAPLGDDERGMRYISVLHNGYIFILYKTGIVGILIYLVFLVRLYLRTYEKQEEMFFKILISTIGLYFLFTSLIITGIYIPQDAILFILGGALFHENNL